VTLAARVGCLLVWIGEGAVRLYSAGRPGGARSDRLLYQARLALDDAARLRVVRKMYALRFKEDPAPGLSPDQLRTLEGHRVRAIYQLLAKQYGVAWTARRYDPNDWAGSDPINKALSAATACIYGVTEAAVLAAGYSPAIGFLHSGKPLSFVYDIADLFKFETVVPVAFRVAAQGIAEPDRAVRLGCRDMFRQSRMLDRIVPAIEDVLSAGELPAPEAPPEAQPVAFPDDSDLDTP
jgi:CRISPR-associated protein Cas1